MNYSRQDTLRKQQAMLLEQRRLLRWYKDGAPDKDGMPEVLEAAGVPATLWDASTDGMHESFRAQIQKWADSLQYLNLYIEGSRKLCKSYTCAALLRKMALRNKVIGWRSWFDLVQRGYDRIRMAELNGDDYADAIYTEAEERWLVSDVIQVLVLDEIDLSKTPDFMLPELHQLVKHRTDWGLRTIMNGRVHRGARAPAAAKEFMRYRNETAYLITDGA